MGVRVGVGVQLVGGWACECTARGSADDCASHLYLIAREARLQWRRLRRRQHVLLRQPDRCRVRPLPPTSRSPHPQGGGGRGLQQQLAQGVLVGEEGSGGLQDG